MPKKRKSCKPRQPVCDSCTTAGMLFGFCNCGYMLPPKELVSAESTTQVCTHRGRHAVSSLYVTAWIVHLTNPLPMQVFFYVLACFKDADWVRPGKEKCIIAFDDACHMLRFAQRRRGLNAQVDSFLDEVITVGACFEIVLWQEFTPCTLDSMCLVFDENCVWLQLISSTSRATRYNAPGTGS